MEQKFAKMVSLAPRVEDSLKKINFITSIPTPAPASAAVVVNPYSVPVVAAPVAVVASPVAVTSSKLINNQIKTIKLQGAKNFAAGLEAGVNAGDVSQVSNKLAICTDNQDEDLDDCRARPAGEKDEEQEEQNAMEAFDNTSASKDFGTAASNFADGVSQKKAGNPNEAAAKIAAPATEER